LLVAPLHSVNVEQSEPYRFRNISLEEGLSNSSVYAILQDSRGFMWFGTRRGLNRWDGREMLVYNHKPMDPNSLPSPRITALTETSDGSLWVGCYDSGLSRFDPISETFHTYSHDSTDMASISSNQITVLAVDSHGTLWIGTRSGLNRYDASEDNFDSFYHDANDVASLADDWITAIAEDGEGDLWFGSNSCRLTYYGYENGQFKRIINPALEPTDVATNRITGLWADPDSDMLWIATFPGGIIRFDPGKNTSTYLGTSASTPKMININPLYAIDKGRDGSLWLASLSGLTSLDPVTTAYRFYETDRSNPHSISGVALQAVYVDKQGLIWTGSNAQGVDVCDPQRFRFEHYRYEPGENSLLAGDAVFGLDVDLQGRLWAATSPSGHHRIDLRTREVKRYQTDDSDPEVWSMNYGSKILVDSRQRVWMGQFEAGLYRLDPGSEHPKPYRHLPGRPEGLSHNDIYSIFESTDSTVWIATNGGGLNRFEEGDDSFSHYRHDPRNPSSIGSDRLYTILEDHQGYLWIGTADAGVDRLDRELGTFTHYRVTDKPNSISSNIVLTLHEDTQQRLWIGTRGGGLCRLDPSRQHFTQIDLEVDPGQIEIMAIQEDAHGNIWISANLGILKLDHEYETISRYQTVDGVQGLEFTWDASTQDPEGYIYFGGQRGFNRFHPDSIKANPHRPPVFLTELWINHERVVTGKEMNGRVVLPKDISFMDTLYLDRYDKVIKFGYAALDYSNPGQNRYRYRLENFDPDWIDAGHLNTVTYTSLDPGWYTLSVIGSNSDRIWNEDGVRLHIYVEPPFWQAVWFRVTVVLFILGTFFMIMWLRTLRLRIQKQRLEKLVRLRTDELQKEMEERQKVEQEKSDMQIEHLRRELLTKSLHLNDKQQIMDSLQSELQELKPEKPEETAGKIRKLIRFLRDRASVHQDWEEFEHWFTSVHVGFYDQLRTEYPDLSPSELKVCALLRLNMISKDIARIMNVQPTSIDMYRHRIRKKLGLTSDENLTASLSQY